MLKSLLKKQVIETFAFFVQNKQGKRRSTGAIIGFAALMLFAFGSISVSLWFICDFLCAPLVAAGQAWLYFAFFGVLATALGVIGSIFYTMTKLYDCKDNDLLLSMPIPSWMILFSRMVSLYLFVLFFEALVLLPAIVAYVMAVGVSGLVTALTAILALLLLAFGSLAVCCILGWLLAVIKAKFPVQKLLTYVASIGMFALIMYLETKMNALLTSFLANTEGVGKALKTWGYPLYQFGRACAGKWLSMAIIAGSFLGLFLLVYFVMSKTYLALATAKKSGKKVKYTAKGYRQDSLFGTLFKKETGRYFHSPMLTLNCFLGSVFLIALPFIVLFSKDILSLRDIPELKKWIALILPIFICAVGSMNIISAAALSLEGENFWIVRSLPVTSNFLLFVKGMTHFIYTAIPALFSAVFLAVLFKIGVINGILMTLVVLLFVAFLAILGLVVNLKLPNLHWTNELVVVKQSLSGFLAMLIGMASVALLVGGWFLFGKYLPVWGYFLSVTAILSAISVLLTVWIYKRGKEIMETL